MRRQAVTLGAMLSSPTDFDWTLWVFPRGEPPWSAESPCILIDLDEPDADFQRVALEKQGHRVTITVQDLQGIVSNAREQRPEAKLRELVDAFNYYCEHDAYLHLGAVDPTG